MCILEGWEGCGSGCFPPGKWRQLSWGLGFDLPNSHIPWSRPGRLWYTLAKLWCMPRPEFKKSGVWWGLGVGSQSIKRDRDEGGRDVG